MSAERIWYKFDNPTSMSLLLGSAAHSARELLENGKVEDAKQLLDFAINEMDKYKSERDQSDKLTALYFGNHAPRPEEPGL